MYTRPTEPRSIGGVLDDAIRLYKAAARGWWLPSLLTGLVNAGVALFIGLTLGLTPQNPAAYLGLLRSPVVVGGYFLIMLASVYLYCVIIGNLNTVFLGGEPRATAGFADALKVLPAAVLATIGSVLAIMGGAILLIIPGIWLFGRLQLWPVALMAERGGAGGALGRSWRLVKGHWWRTATIATIVLLMLIVLMFAVGLVMAAVIAVWRKDMNTTIVVSQAFSTVMKVVLAPAMPAAAVAMYYDLRLRKEGDDLTARVGTLQPA